MEVLIGKQKILDIYTGYLKKEDIFSLVSQKLDLAINEFYLLCNGRHISNEIPSSNKIYIVLKTPGGKGGFGSMLRAIGAQIEKTTNREACRDLSGRRLRDINEEQRLKKWVAEQAEREKEAKERKKRKLEKLLEQPKHTFVDQEYDKERSALPEKVEDAVLKGLEASCSSKRKSEETKTKVVKKKRKLWVDSELDEDISSSDCETENEEEGSESLLKTKTSDSPENLAIAPKNDFEESGGSSLNRVPEINEVSNENVSQLKDSSIKCDAKISTNVN